MNRISTDFDLVRETYCWSACFVSNGSEAKALNSIEEFSRSCPQKKKEEEEKKEKEKKKEKDSANNES